MRVKCVFAFLLGALGLGLPASLATAAPWDRLFTLNRVEADPDNPYTLSEKNGPWMILACSFSGEHAKQQAHELALELRRRYKLPAYVFDKRFEFGEANGRGLDRFGHPIRMRYQAGDDIEEYAVLVGDYRAVDDPDAQATLRKLKYTTPECLKIDGQRPTSRTLAGWRLMQQVVRAQGDEKKDRGPMGHAMVTTNPMLPAEFFNRKTVDNFVLQLNEGYEYNLLNCPGKYTVQVAHFTGGVIINQKTIREIEDGKAKVKSRLAEAAEKAHKLTLALRKKGYEAYEFHDRYASIVTVGSFNSVGSPRPDGKIEIDPQVHMLMKTFGAESSGVAQGAIQVKQFDGIPCDPQPIPVEVPKRSLADDYARNEPRR